MPHAPKIREIGTRIRDAYLAAGYNRAQFARAIGASYPAVIHWENGTKMPSSASVEKVARVLQLSTDWVLNGVGKPPVSVSESGVVRSISGYAKAADESWNEFLQTEPVLCSMLSQDDLLEIRAIRFREGAPSSSAFYRYIAMAKLEHRAGKDIGEALGGTVVKPVPNQDGSVTLQRRGDLPKRRKSL